MAKKTGASPPLGRQIDREFLALQVQRKKSFNPFRRLIRRGVRMGDLHLLCENRLVIIVEMQESLRQHGADSALHFAGFWMNKPRAKHITGRLELLWRLSEPALINKAPHQRNNHEQNECHRKRAKDFNEQRLHALMILQARMRSREADRLKRGGRIEAMGDRFCGITERTAAVLRPLSPARRKSSRRNSNQRDDGLFHNRRMPGGRCGLGPQ